MRLTRLLLLLATGCTGSAPPKSSTESVQVAAVAGASGAPELVDGASGWYDRRRVLDVTGDGIADTLQLIARGPRSDSLVMVLLVRTHGDSIILAAWESDYDFIDPPEEMRVPGPARDSTIRAHYDRVLLSAEVAPFADSTLGQPWVPSAYFGDCDGNAHDCIMTRIIIRTYPDVRFDSLRGLPFDTAAGRRIAADLAARSLVSLTFSYGYESTEVVVWSPIARSFVTVFACC